MTEKTRWKVLPIPKPPSVKVDRIQVLKEYAAEMAAALNALEEEGYQAHTPVSINDWGFLLVGHLPQTHSLGEAITKFAKLLGANELAVPLNFKGRQSMQLIQMALDAAQKAGPSKDEQAVAEISATVLNGSSAEELQLNLQDCKELLASHSDCPNSEDCIVERVLTILTKQLDSKLKQQLQ